MLEADRTAVCGPRYARTSPIARRHERGRWRVKSSSVGGTCRFAGRGFVQPVLKSPCRRLRRSRTPTR
jgi:hypothetical protein